MGDWMVFGEFCQKSGPIVRKTFHAQNFEPNDQINSFLASFMMRAISGDHVFNETNVVFRPCESLIDKVSWHPKPLTALVCSVALYDAYARGYSRIACVAYLTSDEHKLFAVSNWLSSECNSIAKFMYEETLAKYRLDIAECIEAIRFLIADGAAAAQLSETVRTGLNDELRSLIGINERLTTFSPHVAGRRRDDGGVLLGHAGRAAAAAPPDGTQPVHMDAARAIDCAEKLIGKRGVGVLRTLTEICGAAFEEQFRKKMQEAVTTFSWDPLWIVEHALQSMVPLPRLMEKSVREFIRFPDNDVGPGQQNNSNNNNNVGRAAEEHHFCIGDCSAVDPRLLGFPSIGKAPEGPVTALNHHNLYDLLRKYCRQNVSDVINLAFHALACVPIIICCAKSEPIFDAMRVAAMFVPGLLQSRKRRFQLGFLEEKRDCRVSAVDLEQYAVIGCHPSAAMENQNRFYPSAFLWHISDSNGSVRSYLPGRPHSAVDLTKELGFLQEFRDVLEIQQEDQDKDSLSDYIRLSLKRMFFDIGTAAAQVIETVREGCSVNTGSGHLPANVIPDSGRRSNASFAASEASSAPSCPHRVPFVLCESEVTRCLRSCHGYPSVTPDDAVIVTSVARRMLQLISENKFNGCPAA